MAPGGAGGGAADAATLCASQSDTALGGSLRMTKRCHKRAVRLTSQ